MYLSMNGQIILGKALLLTIEFSEEKKKLIPEGTCKIKKEQDSRKCSAQEKIHSAAN